uniref:G-protein coupled receptors family 1 profile domain-containing protein n=1 Tax=Salvator merianae TaxID=96440 RepID=A0A8D0BCT9_SALMN
ISASYALHFNSPLDNSSSRISEVMEIVSMTIYSITLLLGTVGNGLVIFLTGFCMKKTVTTIWYLNLAVADFIFAVCLSLEIISTALENHWPLGRLMCKLDAVIPFLNMFASVFFLTVISADRCISVVHPVWAVNHRTLGRAIQIAIFIWVAASMLSFPYFIFRDTQDFPDGSTQCSYMFGGEDTSGLRNHLSVVAAELIIGFLLPFSTILACYCSIVTKLRRTVFRQVGRSFKIIVVIVVTFFCCWFPFHVVSILDTLEDDSLEMKAFLDIGMPIAYGLISLNSCLNPILYVFCGRFESASDEKSGQSLLLKRTLLRSRIYS